MTRRDCLWTVTAGACLCLALGCRHRIQAVGSGPLTSSGGPAQIETSAPGASPYHPRHHHVSHVRDPQFLGTPHPDPVSPPVTAPPAPTAAPSPRPTVAEPPPKPADGPPLLEALHCLLKKQPEEARRWLERYESPNRDLLRGLLVLAARLSEEPIARTDPQDVAAVLNELEGMQEPLRPRAALTLGAMRFCKWIEKYGDFDPLPDNHQFRAGDLVQVYVELRNFTSARQGTIYLTRLASTVEVLDAEGTVVWRQDCGDRDRPERSHTPWRDYFRNYRFYVPERMPPGLYTLRIHVTDVPTGRTARGSRDFRVTTVPARGS